MTFSFEFSPDMLQPLLEKTENEHKRVLDRLNETRKRIIYDLHLLYPVCEAIAPLKRTSILRGARINIRSPDIMDAITKASRPDITIGDLFFINCSGEHYYVHYAVREPDNSQRKKDLFYHGPGNRHIPIQSIKKFEITDKAPSLIRDYIRSIDWTL